MTSKSPFSVETVSPLRLYLGPTLGAAPPPSRLNTRQELSGALTQMARMMYTSLLSHQTSLQYLAYQTQSGCNGINWNGCWCKCENKTGTASVGFQTYPSV